MHENPILILTQDHENLKELFREFNEAEPFESKEAVFRRIAHELKVHQLLEEEIFYPAVSAALEDGGLLDESLQEHHVIDVLLDELRDMNPVDESGRKEFAAKFKVLTENVEHHFDEEELKMFPEALDANVHEDTRLCREMVRRREELEGAIR
jgi:hemerythrin-like domain-containing protein